LVKEHIAGFYITNADDLDAALAEDARPGRVRRRHRALAERGHP